MRKILLFILLLFTGGCGTNLASSVTNIFSSGSSFSGGPPAPNGWTLWFSPGVTLGAGPSFNFPMWFSPPCPGPTGFRQYCPAVHYLVEGTGPLTGKTLTMSVTIAGNNPIFNFANIEQDNNTCTNPAHVRFYFQQAGDDWSGNGAYAYYRWWSNPAAIILQPGTYTLSVPLTSAGGWSSVNGEFATTAAGGAGFGAALANANTVGMTFGGGCFFGHGVDLLSGSATFKINSFTIQ